MEPIYLIQMRAQEAAYRSRRRRAARLTRGERAACTLAFIAIVVFFLLPVIVWAGSAN